MRYDRVRCPLYTGACGVCTGASESPFHIGSIPPYQLSFRWPLITTLPMRVYFRSPYRPLPCPEFGDSFRSHQAFRPSFIPRRCRWRMWGWQLAYTLARIPHKSLESLIECDFRSHSLPQMAHQLPVATPVDVVPWSRCPGSVYSGFPLHLTSPKMSNSCCGLWPVHQSHVSTLSG